MVKPGMIVGGIVSLGCLALAPLDGGLSAFSSWSAFSAAFGTGTILAGEVAAAGAAGTAVSKIVDGMMGKDNDSERNENADGSPTEKKKDSDSERNENTDGSPTEKKKDNDDGQTNKLDVYLRERSCGTKEAPRLPPWRQGSSNMLTMVLLLWLCSLLIARFMGLRVLLVSFTAGFGLHKILAFV